MWFKFEDMDDWYFGVLMVYSDRFQCFCFHDAVCRESEREREWVVYLCRGCCVYLCDFSSFGIPLCRLLNFCLHRHNWDCRYLHLEVKRDLNILVSLVSRINDIIFINANRKGSWIILDKFPHKRLKLVCVCTLLSLYLYIRVLII